MKCFSRPYGSSLFPFSSSTDESKFALNIEDPQNQAQQGSSFTISIENSETPQISDSQNLIDRNYKNDFIVCQEAVELFSKCSNSTYNSSNGPVNSERRRST